MTLTVILNEISARFDNIAYRPRDSVSTRMLKRQSERLTTLYEEVRPTLIARFAVSRHIAPEVLIASYRRVCELTGTRIPGLEAILDRLASAGP